MLRGSRFSREGGDLKTPFLAGKEKELLESKKWPACFSKSVDITKVQIEAFKPWITRRVTELMGVEDEIVVDYCISQLKFFGETDAKANTENAGDGGVGLNEKPYLDPKKLQINLTGFMAKNARIFVKELWELLILAQDSEYGIPQLFIDEKKREIAEIQSAAKEVDSTLKEMERGSKDEFEGSSYDAVTSMGDHTDGHVKKGVDDEGDDREPSRSRSNGRRRASLSRSKSTSNVWYKHLKYRRRSGHRDRGRYRDVRSRRRRGRHYSPSPSSSTSRSSSPRRYRRAYRSGSHSRRSSESGSYSTDSHSPRSLSEERRVSRDYRRRSRSRSNSSSSRSCSSSSSSHFRRRRRAVRDCRRDKRYRRRSHSYYSHSSSASSRRTRSYTRSSS